MTWQPLIYAVLMLGICFNSLADTQCATVIHSNDRIEWDHSAINISKQCKTYMITLVHEGHLDKSIMGHSWVLTKPQDKLSIIKKLTLAKDTDYVKDDPNIIAHTPLIGGGENTSIVFDTSKLEANQSYVYFCSYPEHADLMWGELILIED